MKPALRDLQAAFAAHIVAGDRADLIAAVAGDTIPADARLRVYRHHVFTSLAAALAVTYRTVQALVGEDFFRGMARAFVAEHLPLQPVLAEYGAGFADFVASYEPARGLSYLADMARLDWSLNAAVLAPAGERLQATDLAAIPAERLPSMSVVLAPDVTLLQSRYPIDRIWAATQPDGAEQTVDLDVGGANLLVQASGFMALSVGEAALVGAVGAGQTLERAAEAAVAADPAFDLSTTFARMLTQGVFAALQQ